MSRLTHVVAPVLWLAAAMSVSACGSGNPTAPSVPVSPPVKPIPLSVQFDELLVTPIAASFSQPAFIRYSICGAIQNVSGQNLIYWMELVVLGPDGSPYAIEQNYSDLVPRKYAPLGIRFGCGLAGATDHDPSHALPVGARLKVHYTLDDGETGTLEAAAARVRQ